MFIITRKSSSYLFELAGVLIEAIVSIVTFFSGVWLSSLSLTSLSSQVDVTHKSRQFATKFPDFLQQ